MDSRSILEIKSVQCGSGVESPCVRNCCLNDDDICLGCFRSIDEIKIWGSSSDELRTHILGMAQQRRAESKKDL